MSVKLDTYVKYIAPKGYNFVQKNNNCFNYLTSCGAVENLTSGIANNYLKDIPLKWSTAVIFEACGEHQMAQERMDTFCLHTVDGYGQKIKLTGTNQRQATQLLAKISAFENATDVQKEELIAPFINAEKEKIQQQAKAKRDELLGQKADLEKQLAELNTQLR